MPDSTIPAPVAADPIDRLALGATDAREMVRSNDASWPGGCLAWCMAEE